MQINKIDNLLELFYQQYQKKNKESIFLQALKKPRKEY
jgi:long-chain acyl-CoA synthetase